MHSKIYAPIKLKTTYNLQFETESINERYTALLNNMYCSIFYDHGYLKKELVTYGSLNKFNSDMDFASTVFHFLLRKSTPSCMVASCSGAA
jgi:hypothetical protein